MASTPNYFTIGFNAGAAIAQGVIVKETGSLSGSNVQTGATATATSDKLMGITDYAYASGEYGTVVAQGVCDWAIAGGTLTPGTTYHLTTDGSGRVVAATAGVAEVKCIGYFVRGARTDGTSHAGEQCTVLVAPHSLAPTGA